MSFAIIVNKAPDGRLEYRSESPLTSALEQQAKELDMYLSKNSQRTEQALVDAGFLSNEESAEPATGKEGSAQMWYLVGSMLRGICEEKGIDSAARRRWLWLALENIHASTRIKRKDRGRLRNNFEYCFRLSRFSKEFVDSVGWSEWVTYFDSRTIREDERIDDWLDESVRNGMKVGRKAFRGFIREMNKRMSRRTGGLDTSVFRREELFNLCNSVWSEVVNESASQ